ncbi:hypothetical protein K435DRAFT_836045 [Dendrothele bispora CBS 962.96]|uniref:F-box domain-containing protein n=1 Tax=Dendrothele bispora (strain CBS 962.96) TaxID=1314807 RepID=A0A4S8MJP7_DENBC|nr:hypothetical protein K435DRAFT_836045 [Dendrothele bispora CBS 962.96]
MNSPYFNGPSLDDDIIDRILMFSPSFSTFQSAILTSRSFYCVYKAHPRSIVQAVACNVTGSSDLVPEALRVARYGDSKDELNDTRESHGVRGVSIEKVDSDEMFITPRIAQRLTINAEVVNQLEDLFSLRHKNRHFKTSQLTPTESFRFRQAMYRVMLYCNVFHRDHYKRWVFEDSDEFKRIQSAKERFLAEFCSRELLRIYDVSCFLVKSISWAGAGNNSMQANHYRAVLAMGPTQILGCIKMRSLNSVTQYRGAGYILNPVFQEYLSGPILKILQTRGQKMPVSFESTYRFQSILDTVEGENDCCNQCRSPAGLNLLGPTTLEYLAWGSETLSPENLFFRLKGRLPFSSADHDREFMLNQVKNTEDPYTKLCDFIFQDGVKLPEFDNWKKDDWLCEACFQKLVEEHLHLWLLDRKRKSIGKDCPYGYHCRTQELVELPHAKRYNHLCAPTRACE